VSGGFSLSGKAAFFLTLFLAVGWNAVSH